jgi:hypothetical protein
MNPENTPDEKELAHWLEKQHHKRKRRHVPGKFLLLAVIAIPLVGAVTMLLWNWLMPSIFGLHSISFPQALGLLLLSKLIFGSFHGGGRRRCGPRWDRNMMERWEAMSPEERRKMIDALRAGREGGESETAPA